MKKSLYLIILSILVLCLCVSGCSKQEESQPADDTPPIDTSYDPADYVELCDY